MEKTIDENLKYIDLLYFGYAYFGEEGEESKRYQREFMNEMETRFLNVQFKNAYDEIKGYRQEVYLDPKDHDNYYAWLIAYGWYDFSLTMKLIMMSGDESEKEKFNHYFKLAKEEYQECFKS